MGSTWLTNGFICRELYAPFSVEKDSDYYYDLRRLFDLVLRQAKKANADDSSIKIIEKCKKKILEAVRCRYRADVAKSNTIILNLLKDIGRNPLAVSPLEESYAFPGRGQELQLFRCRVGNPSRAFSAGDMLYLPKDLRAKSGSYRFSIPGCPSYYLANSSYGCWIEMGFPPENEFNVSPVVLDGSQKIFNLAISIKYFEGLDELDEERVNCWLKLFMLMVATSYKINESGRTFKSEYIVSQAVMMACKKLGYDGVAYFSRRVSDVSFAFCAINLALFVDYTKKGSSLCRHVKIDDSYNYSLFRQLKPESKYRQYDLRVVHNPLTVNIGGYGRQYAYRETEFYSFDSFVFSSWRDRLDGKGKNDISWDINADY